MNTSPTAVEGFSSEFTFTARASQDRDGGTWGAGGAPPYSIRSANVSQLDGGADYAHHITTAPTSPRFSDLPPCLQDEFKSLSLSFKWTLLFL